MLESILQGCVLGVGLERRDDVATGLGQFDLGGLVEDGLVTRKRRAYIVRWKTALVVRSDVSCVVKGTSPLLDEATGQ